MPLLFQCILALCLCLCLCSSVEQLSSSPIPIPSSLSSLPGTAANDIHYGFVFGASQWSSPYAPYNSSSALQSLQLLSKTGATHVRILQQWYTDNINSTSMYANTNRNSTLMTAADDALSVIITAAQSLGLKVVLAPVLDPNWDLPQFQSRDGWCFNVVKRSMDACQSVQHWRGQIGSFFGDTEWQSWFAAYTAYIVRYAQMAELHRIYMFEPASELLTTFAQESLWRALIADVRGAYSGLLTVAGYDSIQFWDALDFIGVEGYQNLQGLTVAEMVASWQPMIAALAKLSAQYSDMPVLITEVGYQSRPMGYTFGANTPRENAVDCSRNEGVCVNETLQAYAYEALFEALRPQPWFAGVYFWLWRTDVWQGGLSDSDFTPHGKRAEAVFHAYATGNGSNRAFNASLVSDRPEYPPEIVFSVDAGVKAVVNERRNGFNYGAGMWSTIDGQRYTYASQQSFESLSNLRKMGANSVKIFVSYLYGSYSSPEINADPVATPTDAELVQVFKDANALGFESIMFAVYLDPTLELALNCTFTDAMYEAPSCPWRGEFGASFSQSQWQEFLQSYESILLHYIPILNAGNVTDYCVATELVTIVTFQSTGMISIINNIRQQGYNGQITIGFNRESGISLDLYAALDYIGEDAYYLLDVAYPNPVPSYPWQNPTLEGLIQAWEAPLIQLQKLANITGKQIVFTEVGYQSRPWSWIVPFATHELDGFDCSVWDQCINVAHQAYAYEALLRAVYAKPWFGGIYWWLWTTDPYQGGPTDDSFAIHGKAAEMILEKYWQH